MLFASVTFLFILKIYFIDDPCQQIQIVLLFSLIWETHFETSVSW